MRRSLPAPQEGVKARIARATGVRLVRVADLRRQPSDTVAESALVVIVPQAEACVAAIRETYDPAARLGAPAHITLVYPFADPAEIGATTLDVAANALSPRPPFAYRLVTPRRFADTLYLAPVPAEPFVALTRLIVHAFPQFPPYGGRFDPVVPHLTLARGGDADLRAAEAILSAVLPGDGIPAHCREVALLENASGRWQPMHVFRLGSTHGERS